LYRLDEQVRGFGGFCPEMKLLPSEYFARQCWISFEIDEPSLPALLPVLGEERAVWGSDYPHHDSTFPRRGARAARDHRSVTRDARGARCSAPTRSTATRCDERVAVIDAYFAAIRAKDADALGALFTDNADS
jgi:hypothetical protein